MKLAAAFTAWLATAAVCTALALVRIYGV